MDSLWHSVITFLVVAAVYLLLRYGWHVGTTFLRRQEKWYEDVLVHQLFIDIHPRTAVWLSALVIVVTALMGYLIVDRFAALVAGATVGALLPSAVVRHLAQKRSERLERQLVDGMTIMISAVRAGLNLGQAIELLVTNSAGPIKEEFSQLLREHQMGMDLNQAMRNASNRIGSSNYRLLFTALQMHHQRGGNLSQSLERLAESIREIQRLEGKLDAITAQGRAQARLMGLMPILIMGILYLIEPDGVRMLFTEPIGRLLLLVAVALIICSFLWIRRIMAVDI